MDCRRNLSGAFNFQPSTLQPATFDPATFKKLLANDLESGGFEFAQELGLVLDINADLIMRVFQGGVAAGAQPRSCGIGLGLQDRNIAATGGDNVGTSHKGLSGS